MVLTADSVALDEIEWYIPGPIDVRTEVRLEMSSYPYGHRTSFMGERIRSIRKNMLALLASDESESYRVLLVGGSGTNAMEIAARSFSESKSEDAVHAAPEVLVASIGYFGDLWADIFKKSGASVENWRIENGKAIVPEELDKKLLSGRYKVVAVTHNETSTGVMNPLQAISEVVAKYDVLFLVDAVSSLGGVSVYPQQLGIDYLVASPQKCLGVPSGLGIAMAGEKAIKKAETIKNRGYTTDLLEYVKSDKKDQTVTTPPQAQIEALALQLDYIVNKEGMINRFNRHRTLAEFTRHSISNSSSSEFGFKLFPDKSCASETVSCFSNTNGFDLAVLKKALLKKGYGFDAGYRKLNDLLKEQGRPTTFRIAHMGDRKEGQLASYLMAVKDTLKEMINRGSSGL